MNEHREEREELEALRRDDEDDARQTREEWAQAQELDHYEFVMLEQESWSR